MDKIKGNFKAVMPFFVFLLILCLASGHYLGEKRYLATKTKTFNDQRIIIDAGHGGFDGGAVALDGTAEKDINLLIAKKLEKLLCFYGFNVVMTRDTDQSTEDLSGNIRLKKKSDMRNRLALMNENADAIFVSIHLNKYTTSDVSGAQVFYSPNNGKSEDLARCIQKSISENLQKENNRVVKKANSSTYLLYNAKIPAVIAECGFISNTKELENLKNDDYQTKTALCILNGILDYFAL